MTRYLALLLLATRLYAADCPATAAAWQPWLKEAWRETSLTDFFNLKRKLEACRKEFPQAYDEAERNCLRPTWTLIRADDRSLENVPRVELKELDVPAELAQIPMHDAAAAREKITAWRAKNPQAIVVERTAERDTHFLIYVPGTDVDRFLNLSYQGNLTLAVNKTSTPPTVLFHNPASRSHPRSCLDCHRASPVIPLLAQTDTKAKVTAIGPKDAVELFNQAAKKYATAQVSGEADYGSIPPIGGPVKQLPARCAEKVSKERTPAILSAMNCAKCHRTGRKAGPLMPPLFAGSRGDALAEGVMHSGHMPEGEDIREGERETLLECLKESYYGGLGPSGPGPGTLMTALTANPCSDAEAKAAKEGEHAK
jgi:hypothetical protein